MARSIVASVVNTDASFGKRVAKPVDVTDASQIRGEPSLLSLGRVAKPQNFSKC